jgi:hypothetical protein
VRRACRHGCLRVSRPLDRSHFFTRPPLLPPVFKGDKKLNRKVAICTVVKVFSSVEDAKEWVKSRM